MKKYLIFVAAVSALVACSENELALRNDDVEKEITYTVAPVVKSANIPFGTNLKFYSSAYYLENGKSADTEWNTAAKEYFKNLEISFVDGVWKNADRQYYWPKNGTLTFYAWAVVKDTVNPSDGSSTYTVTTLQGNRSYIDVNSRGIAYCIDVADDKNVDLMVAEAKLDQSSNDSEDRLYADGVATLFKHQLCKVIFTAGTDKDYSAAGISFKINSIKFSGIRSERGGKVSEKNRGVIRGWADTGADQTYYDGGSTGFTVTEDVKGVYAEGNQYLYAPQSFSKDGADDVYDEDYFEVDYTVTYVIGSGTITENIQKKISLNSADPQKALFEKWEKGKKYTINLTFSLDEILWDPAVEDWDDQPKDLTIE